MMIVRLGKLADGRCLRELADQLASTTGPVAILDKDLIIPRAALAPILDDPFAGTAVLVSSGGASADVRVRHHVAVSSGSTFHQVTAPDHTSLGAMVIAAAEAPFIAVGLRELAGALDTGALGAGPHRGLPLVMVAATRSGRKVRAVEVVEVPWFLAPEDRAQAQALVDAVSSERIARLQANRIDDGFYSTFVVRRLSKPITALALRLGWSPNSITLVSFAVGLISAVAFAQGSVLMRIVGAVLLQLSLIIDCVDGEVARATRRFSALGAWLDASTDRVKEYAAYAGLAVGAWVAGAENVWPLAIILVVLQTVRHISDYDFSRVQWARELRLEARSVLDPGDGADTATWSAGLPSLGRAMEASTRANRREAIRWAKRALHLPIGERWLIISVVAIVAGEAWALRVLLMVGIIAGVYVVTGRLLRTITWRGASPAESATLLQRQSDDGPIAWVVGRLLRIGSRLWPAPVGWLIPVLLRLIELGLVAILVLTFFPSLVILGFAWASLVAFHHYDVLYRAIGGAATPRWITWALGGWEVRSLLLLVGTVIALRQVDAPAVMTWIFGLGLVILVVIGMILASAQWLRQTSAKPAATKAARSG
ncbi:MAG: DUF5941 domain-containing protein [Actinomycetales bacterium]